jgi:hypothetical protein
MELPPSMRALLVVAAKQVRCPCSGMNSHVSRVRLFHLEMFLTRRWGASLTRRQDTAVSMRRRKSTSATPASFPSDSSCTVFRANYSRCHSNTGISGRQGPRKGKVRARSSAVLKLLRTFSHEPGVPTQASRSALSIKNTTQNVLGMTYRAAYSSREGCKVLYIREAN